MMCTTHWIKSKVNTWKAWKLWKLKGLIWVILLSAASVCTIVEKITWLDEKLIAYLDINFCDLVSLVWDPAVKEPVATVALLSHLLQTCVCMEISSHKSRHFTVVDTDDRPDCSHTPTCGRTDCKEIYIFENQNWIWICKKLSKYAWLLNAFLYGYIEHEIKWKK